MGWNATENFLRRVIFPLDKIIFLVTQFFLLEKPTELGHQVTYMIHFMDKVLLPRGYRTTQGDRLLDAIECLASFC